MPKKGTNISKPPAQRGRLAGVSLGKDAKGVFVYTHRARSNSYPTTAKIPDSRIKFVRSTG